MKSADVPKLAIHGGTPVRTEPLPLEFPGVHHMDELEVEAAARVLRARSPFRYYGVDLRYETEQFEEEFRQFIGVKHALAVSSGTGALHVALSSLGVGPGQEVIIPAYLWVSVASAVVNQGAVPVLADIDDTFCLDPADVQRRITPKTTGIILVHMSGAPGDVEAVRDVARRHNLFVLEDCAQCVGGSVNGRMVGSFGDIGIFSFQMNKNMTAGEGGCIVTNDERLYRRVSACHDLGYARDESGRLVMADPDLLMWGRGYRMDELRAAVLRVQLAKLPKTIGAMRGSKQRIRETLSGSSKIRLRRLVDPNGDTGAFLLATFAGPAEARQAVEALRKEGIRTYPQGLSNIVLADFGLHIYYSIPSLVAKSSNDRRGFPWTIPANGGLGGAYERGTCPVADGLFERTIMIPIPSCLTREDEEDIVEGFRKLECQSA
jgi:8-amino-3,8-dideoxy-alpha-D-manno-octulosonate transaminase